MREVDDSKALAGGGAALVAATVRWLLAALIVFLAGQMVAPPLSAQTTDPRGRVSVLGVGDEELRRLRAAVPEGEASGEVIELTIPDAVRRALRQSLAERTAGGAVAAAEARVQSARARRLPDLTANLGFVRSEFNLAASFFRDLPPPGGDSTEAATDRGVVGPFEVWDARFGLRVPLYDRGLALAHDAAAAHLEGQRHHYQGQRDLIVLAVSNLYLTAVAHRTRVEAAVAQLETSRSLRELAASRHAAGMAPAIETLRAEVAMSADEVRLIRAQNELSKSRLDLAYAIGLPAGQRFRLVEDIHFEPLPPTDLDEAIARAFEQRGDWAASAARRHAASSQVRALRAERLPRLAAEANWGRIGPTEDDLEPTWGIAANLSVPIWRSGRIAGALAEALADFRRRDAEHKALEAAIRFQVEAALLDAAAAERTVTVARQAVALGDAQLVQARHRFEEGVANNIEVLRAQEDLARLREILISSLFAHRTAKGAVARALGIAEARLVEYLVGTSLATEPQVNQLHANEEEARR